MPIVLIPFILIHITAVLSKLRIFIAVPKLKSVQEVQSFMSKYKPYERIADWILWLSGIGLLYFAGWKMLIQPWMLISIGLYLIVFIAIRFALINELNKVGTSQKVYANDELKRLRTNNWCVGILAIAFLGIIAYLMMTKP